MSSAIRDGVKGGARKGEPMDDLISRQQAIDAIMGEYPDAHYPDWYASKIRALPSAQLEERTEKRTETHACDLISRQAAIDGKISIQCANGVEIYSDEAVPVEYLKALPSAQPGKTGRWIGKYPFTSACSECNYFIHASKVKVFAYCPNCGADMKGEQHD